MLDLGEVPDAPVFRTHGDWYVGFAVLQSRYPSGIYCVKSR